MDEFNDSHHQDHGMESPDMNSLSGDEVGGDDGELRHDGALQLMALQHDSVDPNIAATPVNNTNHMNINNNNHLGALFHGGAHSNTASLDILASALEARVTAAAAAVQDHDGGGRGDGNEQETEEDTGDPFDRADEEEGDEEEEKVERTYDGELEDDSQDEEETMERSHNDEQDDDPEEDPESQTPENEETNGEQSTGHESPSDDAEMEEDPIEVNEDAGEEDEEAKKSPEMAQDEGSVAPDTTMEDQSSNNMDQLDEGGKVGALASREDETSNDVETEDAEDEPAVKTDGAANNELINKESEDANGEAEVVENPPVVDEAAGERRRRRRKLRRMLKKAGKFPSFLALITAPAVADDNGNDDDDEDDEEDDKMAPECIYIDVDECLSLKSKKPVSDTSATNAVPQMISSSNRPIRQARISSSSKKEGTSKVMPTPAEEGYYEGCVPLAMPEDEQYISPIQQLVRKNLELYSATAEDASSSQAGRRAPVVRGKVGIRCIHCAKVGKEASESASSSAVEPDQVKSAASSTVQTDPHKIPGAVSYPLNIGGMYSICTAKPTLHFESCPNLPPLVKAQFYQLMHENSKDGEGRFRSRGISAAVYYTVSAKRLGLVDANGGVRFGRDLSLEPLPLEAVMANETQQSEGGRTYTAAVESPAVVGSAPTQPRIAADAESEKVLAEAVAEADDPQRCLARAEDKNHVTDFIFLALRQMAICHAVPADFATRGKKTKKMRIGFAGFCCRHCFKERERQDGSAYAWAHATTGASDYSCRSFSSAADNLASAISNSFVLHLQKCPNTPRRVKAALAAYKRLHQRQMAQLVYGSQRRLFHELWARLREADIPENKMMELIEEFRDVTPTPRSSVAATSPSTKRLGESTPVASRSVGVERTADTHAFTEIFVRGPDFPTSNDPETENLLKASENNWEPATNDGLILPSDRDLVSDYVFLTLRQLKLAIPVETDILKGRRGPSTYPTVAGVCCMHCENEDQSLITPSGRSFPSAPDNYASALNTSLYNHMQNCHNIPLELKRALANLRKIHSQQCAKLKFGSQRRFFNILFDRVRKIPVPEFPDLPVASSSTTKGKRKSIDDNGDEDNLTRFGFFEAPLQTYLCTRCRMVPLPFRARGSLCFAKPTLDFVKDHHITCKETGFDLWFAAESLELVVKKHFRSNLSLVTHALFKEVVLQVFGGNDRLADIFTEEISKYIRASRSGGPRAAAVARAIQRKTRGFWSAFPNSVDGEQISQAFERFTSVVQGLSPRLHDHISIVNYFLLISPSIRFPSEDNDGDDDEVLDDDEPERKRSRTGGGEDEDDDGEELVGNVENGDNNKGGLNDQKMEVDDGARGETDIGDQQQGSVPESEERVGGDLGNKETDTCTGAPNQRG